MGVKAPLREPGGITTVAGVLVTPSAVAVMEAVPGTLPVTTPSLFTVATSGRSVTHVTGRSGRGVPAILVTVAVRSRVSPGWSSAEVGVIVTWAAWFSSATTMNVSGSLSTPWALAWIAVCPGATPVTVPSEETEATEESNVSHVNTVWDSASPAPS